MYIHISEISNKVRLKRNGYVVLYLSLKKTQQHQKIFLRTANVKQETVLN